MIAASRKRGTAVLASGDGESDFVVRMFRGTHNVLAERSHRRQIDGCRIRVQPPLALQSITVWIFAPPQWEAAKIPVVPVTHSG